MQYINNMRGIAILMIIVAHSMLATGKVGGAAVYVDFIAGNGTIVFMFISGFLFARTSEDLDYFPFLRNKALTVVLPYLVTSLPITLAFVFEIGTRHRWIDMDWYFSLNLVERYLFMVVTGAQLGPLWFIPMIVLIYLAAPVFAFLQRSPLLVPVFVATLVIAYVLKRAPHNANTFHSFAYYLPVYLLGIMACRYEKLGDRLVPLAVPLLGLYLLFETVLFALVFSAPDQRITSSPALLLNIPLTVLIMLACKQALSRKNIVLDLFARLSFFIYFVHGYFTGVLRNILKLILGPDIAIPNPVFDVAAIAGTALFAIVASLTLYVGLKYVTKDKSRYLIGA